MIDFFLFMKKEAKFTISSVNMAERQKLDIRPGTTIKVYQKIQEKGKTRLQVFEGLVIAHKHQTEAGATFTVRKVASGVGMEKIFPLYSPMIDKVEIVKRSKTRRAKLYYIRAKAAKEVRRRMKQLSTEAILRRKTGKESNEVEIMETDLEMEDQGKGIEIEKEETPKVETVK